MAPRSGLALRAALAGVAGSPGRRRRGRRRGRRLADHLRRHPRPAARGAAGDWPGGRARPACRATTSRWSGGRFGTGPYHAIVRATSTGKVIAAVTPPRPYGSFTLTAGSGDGRAFVLAAIRPGNRPVPTKFFLLRIGRGAGDVTLTALPIPAVPADAEVSGIALTPDAAKLAVALRGGTGGGTGPAIRVYTLATGDHRVWTWPAAGRSPTTPAARARCCHGPRMTGLLPSSSGRATASTSACSTRRRPATACVPTAGGGGVARRRGKPPFRARQGQ